MAFDNIRKSLGLMPQEEIDALSDPSVMDEYLKKNDPEQYNKIQQAQSLKTAQESGPGLIGSMGIVNKVNPEMEQLTNYLKLRKETDPNFGKMDDAIKAMPAKDPNFQRLSQEEIDRLRKQVREPHDQSKFFDKLKTMINK